MSAEQVQERVHGLIMGAATSERRLLPEEWAEVLAHVAQAGFDPLPRSEAGGRLAGIDWQGRTLRGKDRLPAAEAHYLRHCVAVNEWPPGTTLDD